MKRILVMIMAVCLLASCATPKYANRSLTSEVKSDNREYIKSHLAMYNQYKDDIKRISGSGMKHEKNLLLGRYFLAWQSISTPIMMEFGGPKVAAAREEMREKAEQLYKDTQLYGSLLYYGNADSESCSYVKMSSGTLSKNPTVTGTLIGFVYLKNGKWKYPLSFNTEFDTKSMKYHDSSSLDGYKVCLTDVPKGSRVKYRILYEIDSPDGYYVIDVPEDWYFKDMFIK